MLGHICNQKSFGLLPSKGEESNLNILINRYDYDSNSWSSGSRPIYPEDAFNGSDCDTIQLFENLKFKGEEFVGEEFYESLSSTGQYYADCVRWASHNINLYSGVNANSYQIGIPIRSSLFGLLTNISIDSSSSFYIPALSIDNELVAYFYVSGTTTRLIVKECGYIFDVHQTYVSSDDNWHVFSDYHLWSNEIYYFVFDIDSLKKNSITSISKIDEYSFSTSQHPFYNYEYSLGYCEVGDPSNYPFLYSLKSGNNCVVSPYDLTYLNLNGVYDENDYWSGSYGHFSLGNSIYGELYGTHRPYCTLLEITFRVKYSGISPELDGEGLLQFMRMDDDDYDNYCNHELSLSLSNTFFFGSRGRFADEVGGEGSLISAYCIPVLGLQNIDDSIISVYSMTFVKTDVSLSDYLYAPYDPREDLTNNGVQYSTETIYFPCDISSYEKARGISYKYHSDPAVGKCSQETLGINVSNEKVTTYTSSPVVYSLATLGYGWLGTIAVYVVDSVVSGILSSGKNIQRILFNLYDSKNQLIRNITQLQFAYQLGNHDPDYEDSDDNIYNLKPIKGLNIKFITVGDSETLVSQVSNFWRTESTQENGFMQCDEGHEYSMNGIKYSCYYQNIYNTKTRNDFMCYWSALSVWHVIESGETERLTTNVDGYYLVYDEDDMNWHVVSIDNPDEDAGISVDDYLNGDTYGHSDGFEPPEDNDFDKKMKNLFSNLFSGLEDLGKWFLILNAVVLGIGLIGGIAYLIIRFGGFLGLGGSKSTTTINLNGVNSAKKNKTKKEKHKRKKGK